MIVRNAYDVELSKRLAKRSLKCDTDILLEGIQLDQRVIDNGWQFLLDDKVLDFFEQRFDYLYQNKDTYSMYENFLQRMFIETGDNFVYQQMMEYVRSYIDWRELSDGEMSSVPRAMVSREMDTFDQALSKYYEQYKEALQKELEEDNWSDLAFFYELATKEDIEYFRKVYFAYMNEIFIFIYTYLYVNEFEPDFSLVDEVEKSQIAAKILMGKAIDSSHRVVNFGDDRRKRELIDYLLVKMREKQVSYQKTNNLPVARGTIYK